MTFVLRWGFRTLLFSTSTYDIFNKQLKEAKYFKMIDLYPSQMVGLHLTRVVALLRDPLALHFV